MEGEGVATHIYATTDARRQTHSAAYMTVQRMRAHSLDDKLTRRIIESASRLASVLLTLRTAQ